VREARFALFFGSLISAIVLAAGSSERFGSENKLLALVDGKTVIRRCVQAVARAGVDEIVVVTGYERGAIEKEIKAHTESDGTCKILFAHNRRFSKGMGGSISIGVRKASSKADGYLIVPGDMAWLSEGALRRVIQAVFPGSIVTCVSEKRRSSPTLFSSRFRNDLLSLSGDEGAKSLLFAYEKLVIEVPVPDGELQDVDEPSDLN